MTNVGQPVASFRRNEAIDRTLRFCLFAMFASLLVCGTLFWNEARSAIRVWTESPTFNWIILVIPLCVFLVWQRRDEVRGMPIVPDMRAAALIFALSIVWLVVSTIGILEAQQFVVVSIVQAGLLGCLGSALYRRLLAPLLYLYFLVPTGTFLLPLLQGITSRFAVAGLHLLGIPVFSNGAVIEIPVGTFAVAEACAGLRFLIAAVAFGVFYAVLTYRSYWRRAAFITLTLIVPVAANGLRVLGLLVAAQTLGSPAAALADHETYGWVFFSVILVALTIIGRSFSDGDAEDRTMATVPQTSARPGPGIRQVLLAAAAFLLAAISGPAMASFLGSSATLELPRSGPSVASPWRQIPTPGDWQPLVVKTARSFSDSFSDGSTRVERFVALYARHGSGSSLVRAENRAADERVWSYNSQFDTQLSAGRERYPAHVTVWLQGTQQLTVWSFYVVNANPVSHAWDAKWQDLLEYLRRSRCVSGYEAIATTGTAGPVTNGVVERFLAASQPLHSYFCSR